MSLFYPLYVKTQPQDFYKYLESLNGEKNLFTMSVKLLEKKIFLVAFGIFKGEVNIGEIKV